MSFFHKFLITRNDGTDAEVVLHRHINVKIQRIQYGIGG
jgi:hypothetical protein